MSLQTKEKKTKHDLKIKLFFLCFSKSDSTMRETSTGTLKAKRNSLIKISINMQVLILDSGLV